MSYELLGISEANLDDLRTELGAIVDRYRGKKEEGKDIDTVEVTRSDSCEDLSSSAEYNGYAKDTAPSRVDLVFEHDQVGKVRLRVSTRRGSIWFVNTVPESVMDEVFEALRRVKGF